MIAPEVGIALQRKVCSQQAILTRLAHKVKPLEALQKMPGRNATSAALGVVR
jgi:hypothetical protein